MENEIKDGFKKVCKKCGEEIKNCICLRKLKWLLAFLLVFLGIFLSVASIGKSINSALNPRTIVVSGKGEVMAVPDVSTIYFTIRSSSSDKDTKKLQDNVSKSANDVLAKLKDLGIAEKDIKTTDYSVNPKYGYQACGAVSMLSSIAPCQTSVVSGYEATESFSVKVRNSDNVSKVLSVLADAKITEVSGPNFEVDDIDKVKDQARNEAIADAKEKAKELGKQLGVNITKIVAFSDNSDNSSYPVAYKAMNLADSRVQTEATGAAISQGEQKITSNISITFEIK